MSERTCTRHLSSWTVALAVVLAGSLAQAEGDTSGPLAEMLDQTGLVWTPVEQSPDSWKVPFEGGEDASTIEVFLTYNDENRRYALVFATAVDMPAGYDFGKDVLVECMRFNNDYAGAKFCLDFPNGDIDCQTEMLISTLTAESLKFYLELVASFVDDHGARLRELTR